MRRGLWLMLSLILIGVSVGTVLIQVDSQERIIILGVVLGVGLFVLGLIGLSIVLRPKYRCLTCHTKFKTSKKMVEHSFKTGHDTLAKYWFSNRSEIGVKFEDD